MTKNKKVEEINTGEVPGDGSCFFHAVLVSLKYTLTYDDAKPSMDHLTSKDMDGRKFHAAMMEHALNIYNTNHLVSSREVASENEYRKMIDQVKSAKGKLRFKLWADEPEIRATSAFLGRDIYIRKTFTNEPPKHIKPISPKDESPIPRTGSPINLFYSGTKGNVEGCHYNADIQETKKLHDMWKYSLCFFKAVVEGLPYTSSTHIPVSSPEELLDATKMTIAKKNYNTLPGSGTFGKEEPLNVLVNEIHHESSSTKHPVKPLVTVIEKVIDRYIIIYGLEGNAYVRLGTLDMNTYRESPIILQKIPAGKDMCQYKLDIRKTQDWSLYGALSKIAPSGLQHPIEFEKIVRSQEPKNKQEELDIIAKSIEKNIEIISFKENPEGKMILKTNIGSNVETVRVGFKHRYFILDGTSTALPTMAKRSGHPRTLRFRTTSNVKQHGEIRKEAQTLKAVINTNVPNIGAKEGVYNVPDQNREGLENTENNKGSNTNNVNNNKRSTPNNVNNNKKRVEKELYTAVNRIEKASEHAHTPQEQRLVDVDMDAVVAKVVEYFKQHDPKALQHLIQTSQSSPGLWKKVRKHLGRAATGAGKRVDRVVQQSTVGDWGILGIAVSVGIPVVSSYLSFWRAFTGV